MTQTITQKFLKVFNPKDQKHVEWLGKMNDMAENIGDITAHVSLVKQVNLNPMNLKLDEKDALDWPNIHFVLSAAYAKAVLKRQAWTP